MSTITPPPTEPNRGSPASSPVGGGGFQRFPEAAPPGRVPRGNLVAYLLILFGVLFLLATLVPVGGGVFLLGLGLAFLVARLTTEHAGYAVPVGILTGLGVFVSVQEAGLLPGDSGGWALVCLGLGFLAIYPLLGHPEAFWPLIPGAIRFALGVALVEVTALAPLAVYAWAARYWPVGLVLLGLWVLAWDALPSPARQVLGVILVTALVLVGMLALAVTMAATVAPGFPGAFGGPLGTVVPSTGEATTLSAPIAAGQTLRITNPTGGSVPVVAGDAGSVRAQVTRGLGWGPPAAVGLTSSSDGVSLDAQSTSAWPNPSPPVSLVVTAPRDVPVSVQTSSGSVVIDDRAAAVQVASSSGSVAVARIDGPADVQTSSGEIQPATVTGDVNVSSSSGSIAGSGLRHLRRAQTSSGGIRLSGVFDDDALVQSSSGGISLGLAPASASRITVTTTSGGISTGALPLTDVSQSPHRLSATLGAGRGTLTIATTSGGVQLGPAV
jgi:hypothetical protein